MMKVAINGFGRIGRLVLRALYESKKKYNFDIVAINDIQEIDTAIHLLKYDSVHGPFRDKVQKISEKEFRINQSRIIYVSEKFPERLPWKDLGVDLVMECTGMFKIRDLYGRHIKAGAKKVLLSFPADDSDKTVVYGVNHYSIDNEKDIFVSNASCTTNCLAHLIKILHWKVGIQNGFMTTIHSYTGDQRLIDTNHSDLRRSRAAAMCMVPTSSGATNTIGKIFPELEGKLSGLSIRVP
ncbi:MAG: erythrose-4-phosphate dehydrogenase, partial [Holosporaceae bacterium]|nr:erythrose-4-phosphate dehydrogenase [Holosporaceae bacterium]